LTPVPSATQLQHLLSFTRTAELGSFSAAARALGVTPAAVSKNVARLEASLRRRLFQRSTRRLKLTEVGELFLRRIDEPLRALNGAVTGARDADSEPAGTLKIATGPGFGRRFLVPLLGEFLTRFPRVSPDWHFDNRPVDIIGEGFDVAIGGGFPLASGVVARRLAPVHIVAVAAPSYLAGRPVPRTPADIAGLDGILRRSAPTGRVRPWTLRARRGDEQPVPCKPRLVLSDPEAVADAARLGLGVALLPMPFAVEPLRSGELVRLLPGWYGDGGDLCLYYPSQRLLPAKTRAFSDFVVQRFSAAGFAKLVDARR